MLMVLNRMRRVLILTALSLLGFTAGASNSLAFVCPTAPGSPEGEALSPAQKHRLMQLTSIFENSDPKFEYGYIENLHDGRGFTAGRVGFCTGTHDLIQVARLYADFKPENPLTPFLARLEELDQNASDSVTGLAKFERAWKKAALDAEMTCAQDLVTDQLYYLPAIKRAQQIGITLPFGLAMIYDTIVMHGEDGDPDGLPALMKRTTEALGGRTPKDGLTQLEWLKKFAEIRKADLLHPTSAATQKEWAQNAGRADILKKMLLSGSYDQLAGPMKIKNEYYEGTLP